MNAEARQAAGRTVTRPGITPVIAWRAAGQIDTLRTMLADWNAFYDGYDPLYSWWAREPFGRLDKTLIAYGEALRQHLAGIRPGEKAPIIGDPVLADGLRADLAYEMIPYNAEELIAIGMKEFEWTENQFRTVARSMGTNGIWMRFFLRSMANAITYGGRWIRTIMSWIFWCKADATNRRRRSFSASCSRAYSTCHG